MEEEEISKTLVLNSTLTRVEFYNLHTSPNGITRASESRTVRRANERDKKCLQVSVGSSEEKRPLEDLIILQKYIDKLWVGFS
jgi:hypothetical protein